VAAPMIPMGVLLLCLLAACVTDWRHRKIPNRLVLVGIAAALLCSALIDGTIGFAQAALGGLVGLGIFLPLYAIRWVGAGDAKLMAMVGLFLGPAGAAWSALYAFVAGGILAIVMLLMFGGWASAREKIQLLFISLVFRIRGAPIPMPVESGEKALRLPYALAIAAGTLAWIALSGGLAFTNMAS